MKFTAILLTSLAALAFNATAADEAKKPANKPDPEAMFKKIDTNSDNSISLEEWKATKQSQKDLTKAEAAFKNKDKDSDSKLTLEEFKAHGKGKGKGEGKGKEEKKEEVKKPAEAPAAPAK